MELLVQPRDGAAPMLDAVSRARTSLDVAIFRFDLKPVEKALEAAVRRGVAVRALIAHMNSSGEKGLRQLERRLLDVGVTVTRTSGDLVRYHGKWMVVDREELHLYGFNYAALDLKSRSFGLVTRERRTVQEALRLFEADVLRQEFETDHDQLVVSPDNAREQLATFIKRTRRQLVIWDPKVTDLQMMRLLAQRVRAGVDVRIIGRVAKRGGDLRAQRMPGLRLHVRAMVRDGEAAFIGSQSLRALELDARREVGLIVHDARVVKGLLEVFEEDWARTDAGQKPPRAREPRDGVDARAAAAASAG